MRVSLILCTALWLVVFLHLTGAFPNTVEFSALMKRYAFQLRNNPHVKELRPGEIKRVRQIWKKMYSNKEVDGKLIVRGFLESHSGGIQFAAHVNKEKIEENPLLGPMVGKLMDSIDRIIKVVHNKTELRRRLKDLGEALSLLGRKRSHYLHLRSTIINFMGDKYKISQQTKAAVRKAFDLCLPMLYEGLESKWSTASTTTTPHATKSKSL